MTFLHNIVPAVRFSLIVVIIAFAAGAQRADAANVPIVNPSFETDVLADGFWIDGYDAEVTSAPRVALYCFGRAPTVRVTGLSSNVNFDFSSKPSSSLRYSKGPPTTGSGISLSFSGPSLTTATAAISIARRT
jgi:hypothetical protein